MREEYQREIRKSATEERERETEREDRQRKRENERRVVGKRSQGITGIHKKSKP